jgi:xanthine/CO dehydrogenase XdhC/CoxF family maturation factor
VAAATLRSVAGASAACEDQSMQDEIYREIATAIEAGEPVVLATVARTRGSTPRKTGAKMVVRRDGSFFGTIGGGCGEAEVWQEAMDVMADGAARIVTVDLTQPVDGDDKICGGVMDVFVERLS